MLNKIIVLILICNITIAFFARAENDYEKFENFIENYYSQLDPYELIDFNALRFALIGYFNIKKSLGNDDFISIIDFNLPSNEKRFFLIDVVNKKIIYNLLVAHGKLSGELYAESFSNDLNSNKSSLGFYLTAETYFGAHDYSLRLDGLDEGFNDNAFIRDIVIHGASYVSEEFILTYGRLGRSLGCPALPIDIASEVIEIIKNGSLLFIYKEDPEYIKTSKYLDLEKAIQKFKKIDFH
jgi:hypothetical protein